MFYDYYNSYNVGNHEYGVMMGFRTGYETSGLTWDSLREGHFYNALYNRMIDTLMANSNYKVLVRATSCQPCYVNTANAFYPYPLWFMAPAQYYNGGCSCYPNIQTYTDTLPNMVLCGTGVDSNITAYNIEFYAPDLTGCGNCPSFATGYIAGQIMAIMDLRDCDGWEARHCARMTTGTAYTLKNGYGKINIDSAVAYTGDIPADPYLNNSALGNTYPVTSVEEGDTYFRYRTSNYTPNALNYLFYVEDTLRYTMHFENYSTTPLIYAGDRSFDGYKKVYYQVTNRSGHSKTSKDSYIRFKKYSQIIVK